MSNIEVGEYCRTKEGFIGKIEQINKEPTDNNIIYVVTDSWVDIDEEIVKHSKNIIDLIKRGDYVNGCKVIDIQAGYLYLDKTNPQTELCVTLVDYQIKSIVTKEQFKEMEYRVDE